MSEQPPHTFDPYEDRSEDLSWLDQTKRDGTPLDDEDVPILDEPPFVTQVRSMEGGPYLIAPDSGEQVPTDFFQGSTKESMEQALEVASQRPDHVTADGKRILIPETTRLLESGGPAAKKLLETLRRGIDATTPKFEAAVHKRMRDAGIE
jgi:hypothetical protein